MKIHPIAAGSADEGKVLWVCGTSRSWKGKEMDSFLGCPEEMNAALLKP